MNINPLSLPPIKEYRLYLQLMPDDQLQTAKMRLRGVDGELAKNYRQAIYHELNKRGLLPRKNVFWPPDEDEYEDEYEDEFEDDEYLDEDLWLDNPTYPTHRNGGMWPGFSSYGLPGAVYGVLALLALRIWTRR